MILPDLRCERCGRPRSFYVTADGRRVGYCNFCRREAYHKRTGTMRTLGRSTCKRGHRKTPWTHGLYGGKVRCILCAKENGRKPRPGRVRVAA